MFHALRNTVYDRPRLANVATVTVAVPRRTLLFHDQTAMRPASCNQTPLEALQETPEAR